jgi:hypothetical protein
MKGIFFVVGYARCGKKVPGLKYVLLEAFADCFINLFINSLTNVFR